MIKRSKCCRAKYIAYWHENDLYLQCSKCKKICSIIGHLIPFEGTVAEEKVKIKSLEEIL